MRIKVSDLSLEHLESHPIWTWSEDSLSEAEDSICPVESADQDMSEASALFIYAEFHSADGQTFRGEISYDVDFDEVYEITIYLGCKSFDFSNRLKDMAEEELDRFRRFVGRDDLSVFPMKYRILANGLPIPDGSFDIRS